MKEENLGSYDIETGYYEESDGIIPCLSFVNEDEDVFAGMCYSLLDEEKELVMKCLYDSDFLLKHTNPRDDITYIPPVKGKIYFRDYSSHTDEGHCIAWIFQQAELQNIHNFVAWYSDFDKKGTTDRLKEHSDVWDYLPTGDWNVWDAYSLVDIMPMFVGAEGMQSFEGRAALHWSARSSLGYGKIIRTTNGEPNGKKKTIPELVANDRVLLTIYNIWDSILPMRINKKYKDLAGRKKSHCDYCGLNLEDWQENAYLVEQLIQNRVYPERILPSRGQNKYFHSIKGGFVKVPKKGLFAPCIELDITKTYPNVMISGNMSSETIVDVPCSICKNRAFCDVKDKVYDFVKRREESHQKVVNICLRPDDLVPLCKDKKTRTELEKIKKKIRTTIPHGWVYDRILDGKLMPLDGFIDPHEAAKCLSTELEFDSEYPVAIFPSGTIYRRDIESPVPTMLREMTQKRDEVRAEMKKLQNEKDYLRKAGTLTKEKEAELDSLIDIYFAHQFSLKSVMNAVYGLFVFHKFRLADSRVGADVTDVARRQVAWNIVKIEDYKLNISDVIEGYDGQFKAEVIYGDSVSKDTMVFAKINKIIKYVEIEELFKIDKSYVNMGKEYSSPNIDVLSIDYYGNVKFFPINKIIRHRINKKQMWRVNVTNDWHVDMTADHSIIGYLGNNAMDRLSKKGISIDKKGLGKRINLLIQDRLYETKPEELGDVIKSLLTHRKIPREHIIDMDFSKEVYELMGLFIGDGSFSLNKYNKSYFIRLASGKEDFNEIIDKVILPLKEQGYIKNFWVGKKYGITMNGNIVKIFNKYLWLGGYKKKVPDFIYEETEENIRSFLRGLFTADGTIIIRNNNPIIRFTNTNYDFIRACTRLLWFVGISNSYFKENKCNNYKGKMSKTYSKHVVIKDSKKYRDDIAFILKRKNDRCLKILDNYQYSPKRNVSSSGLDIQHFKSAKKIDYKGYVYDIEVDGPRRMFFGNGILLHNTDSCKFIISNLDEIENTIGRKLTEEELWSVANKYTEYVNSTYEEFARGVLGQVSDIAFEVKVEDVMKSFFNWGKKKNYFYMTFDSDESHKKGVERSDKTLLFKEFVDNISIHILNNDVISLGNFISKFEEELLSGEKAHLIGRPRGVRTGADEDGEISDTSKGYIEAMEYSNSAFGKKFVIGDKPVFFSNVIAVEGWSPPTRGMIALEYGDDLKKYGIKIDYKAVLEKFKSSNSVKGMLAPLGGWENLKSGFVPNEGDIDDIWS